MSNESRFIGRVRLHRHTCPDGHHTSAIAAVAGNEAMEPATGTNATVAGTGFACRR
jgi:hypothetical protein